MAKILRTMGNEDAIKILQSAQHGLHGTTDAHKRLGMSVKRYYYRLNKLMDVGLLIKENEKYGLTPLGQIICDSMERRVMWAIENTDQLRIMETLKTSKNIDVETVKRVTTDLLGCKFADIQLGSSSRVIQTYEELVGATVNLTERAVEKIHLATRYSDIQAAEAAWRAVRRGVDIRLIDGAIGHFSGRMKVIEMLIGHPKLIKMFYELWHSDKAQVMYREIPFSFMVVDNKDSCMEILNPVMRDFFVAIEFENNDVICSKLMKTFDNLWRKGEKEDPFLKLSEDLFRGIGE